MYGQKKVLICITPQSNSKRLIDKGFEIALANNAEMHILHVVKGENLFLNTDSTALLQHLFDYGTELGGIVHGLCGEDVVDTIIKFAKTEKITHVLLGQPPDNAPVESMGVYLKMMAVLPYLTIEVLNRA